MSIPVSNIISNVYRVSCVTRTINAGKREALLIASLTETPITPCNTYNS